MNCNIFTKKLNDVAVKSNFTRFFETQAQHPQTTESIGISDSKIVHDFNNILSGIIAYSLLAKRNLNNPDKSGKYIDQIINYSEKAVNQILNNKKTLNNKKIKHTEKCHVVLSELINEIIDLYRTILPEGIKLKKKITSESVIDASPDRIYQVVMNLLTNATHAIGNEGVLTINVFDTCLKLNNLEKNFIKLEIIDTGHGIDRKNIKNVFEPYFTTKDRSRGTGLGIPITASIVKKLGGYIFIDSKIGKGTSVNVYFPQEKS